MKRWTSHIVFLRSSSTYQLSVMLFYNQVELKAMLFSFKKLWHNPFVLLKYSFFRRRSTTKIIYRYTFSSYQATQTNFLTFYFCFRWEEGKLLLNRSNFFKDLEFYDMKSMPDSIFRGLKVFYNNPKFRPEIVQEGSMAAKSLCMWVRAVYEFCLVYRALDPKRQQLARAEQELEKVKGEFKSYVYAKRETWIWITSPSFSLIDVYRLLLYSKINSFTPVLSIRIVPGSVYLLIFYSEKFSARIWRLPFVVNVTLYLSKNYF